VVLPRHVPDRPRCGVVLTKRICKQLAEERSHPLRGWSGQTVVRNERGGLTAAHGVLCRQAHAPAGRGAHAPPARAMHARPGTTIASLQPLAAAVLLELQKILANEGFIRLTSGRLKLDSTWRYVKELHVLRFSEESQTDDT
jgi:hypothetical protein